MTTNGTTPEFRGGDGEPLLLLHGAGGSWRVWRPVLDELVGRFDVLAPTLPGHRGGPPLMRPTTVDAFTDHVERYLDAAGLDRVHAAGVSLGGILAVELVRRGRALSSVNFGGPSAAVAREHYETFCAGAERALRLQRVPGLSRAIRALGARSPGFRRRLLAGGIGGADRMPREHFVDLMTDGAEATLGTELVRSVLDDGMLEPFDVGGVPTIIAWGTDDASVSLEHFGIATHEFARGSQLRVMDGVAHVPLWDAGETVVGLILEAAGRGPYVDR